MPGDHNERLELLELIETGVGSPQEITDRDLRTELAATSARCGWPAVEPLVVAFQQAGGTFSDEPRGRSLAEREADQLARRALVVACETQPTSSS